MCQGDGGVVHELRSVHIVSQPYLGGVLLMLLALLMRGTECWAWRGNRSAGQASGRW